MSGARALGLATCTLLLAGLALAQEPPDPAAVDSLRAALRARRLDTRLDAAGRLGALGAAAERAVPDLAARLDDDDGVGDLAAFALARVGPSGRAALDHAALHGGALARPRAISQLPCDAGSLPVLLDAVHDQDAVVRRCAVRRLGETGDPGAVPALLRSLDGEVDDQVRAGAARALGRLGVRSPEVVDGLVRSLRDPATEHDTPGALRALRPIGPGAARAIAVLLRDADPTARSAATSAAASVGPEVLLEALHDPSEAVRGEAIAVFAFGAYRDAPPDPEERLLVLRAAIEGLDDPSRVVRAVAALALSRLAPDLVAGSTLGSALRRLVAHLGDEDRDVQRTVNEALSAIGDELMVTGAPAPTWLLGVAYWRRGLSLLLGCATWFGLAAFYPRRRPARRLARALWIALVVATPTALACAATLAALSAPWVAPFLPRVGLLLPLPVVAALSACGPCLLAGAWVVLRERGDEVVG